MVDRKEKPSKGFGFWKWVAVGLIAAAGLFVFLRGKANRVINKKMPTTTVQRGPLTISMTEAGVLSNKERKVVRSEVKGRNTVIWAIEEGKTVSEGDLLVELDSSKLEESRIDEQIKVENTEASKIQAEENLAIVKNQAQADIEKAELDVKFKAMELKKYEEGEYPSKVQEAGADITIAEEELRRAEQDLDWTRKLSEDGYVTRNELQADELAVKKSRIQLDLAKTRSGLLKEYTHEQELEKLKSDAKQSEMALERVKRKAKANIIQAEANLRAKTSEYNRQKKKLDDLNEQIEKCRITAPADGMVVFPKGGRHPWDRQNEPLEAGQEVNERQELIHLPTSDEMMVDVSVPESSRSRMKEGVKARISIDAVPGLVLDGEVVRIGILPDSRQAWLNPDLKVYECDVEITGSNPALRPGMSCAVELIIEELADALYVPIQCVVQIDGKSVVYVNGWRGAVSKEVEVGLDNNRVVHIKNGLNEGEEVLLDPPLKESAKPSAGSRGKKRTKRSTEK